MEINPNTRELERIDECLFELEQEKTDLFSQKEQLLDIAFSYTTIKWLYLTGHTT